MGAIRNRARIDGKVESSWPSVYERECAAFALVMDPNIQIVEARLPVGECRLLADVKSIVDACKLAADAIIADHPARFPGNWLHIRVGDPPEGFIGACAEMIRDQLRMEMKIPAPDELNAGFVSVEYFLLEIPPRGGGVPHIFPGRHQEKNGALHYESPNYPHTVTLTVFLRHPAGGQMMFFNGEHDGEPFERIAPTPLENTKHCVCRGGDLWVQVTPYGGDGPTGNVAEFITVTVLAA